MGRVWSLSADCILASILHFMTNDLPGAPPLVSATLTKWKKKRRPRPRGVRPRAAPLYLSKCAKRTRSSANKLTKQQRKAKDRR